MDKDRIRWGILSTALIGTEKVIPGIQRSRYGLVSAIASRSEERARAAAERLAIPRFYGSYDEVLADSEIDAIYNPLPNDMHVDWTIAALRAGKHVLCEKPLGMTAADAERLRPEIGGRKMMEAFMIRFHPQWLEARAIVDSGRIGTHVDIASYIIDQLKQVGIEATLEQVETGVWHPKMTRGEFDVGVNLTGIGPDDPDANFYENFKCGSARNYSDYCSKEIDSLIEKQSQTTDQKKRLQLVNEIDKRLQLDGARLMLGWSKEYVVMWPYVKNLVPHQSIYNYGRMQEVWLDK